MDGAHGRPRVVVVGAGFGGLWAARELGGEDVDALLLDRNNFHTFYPLLYQIGAAELDTDEIAYPIRKILRRHRNVGFRMGEVTEVDLDRRRVRAADEWIPYDHLVLATGSDPHFFGVEGAAEHAFPLREVEDGIALRNHVLSRFERAERLGCDRRRRALTFVIVGGGPTGVEYAGALAELVFRPLLRDHPEIEAGEIRILLLEATHRLLSGFPPKLGDYAAHRLREMGVDVRLRTAVEVIRRDAVTLASGVEVPAETVVWTAGVRGDPAAADWGLPVDGSGRVRVEPTLQLPGHPEVHVVGDLARVEPAPGRATEAAGDGGEGGVRSLPMIAPVAIQEGTHAARNILRGLAGEPPEPFRYRDQGMLATIGRNAAVAHVFGLELTGFVAWILWVGVHIAKLIGFRNRLVVLTNWAWDYFTYERVVRLILPLGRAERPGAAPHGDPAGPPGDDAGTPGVDDAGDG